jgi:hypothetical protein
MVAHDLASAPSANNRSTCDDVCILTDGRTKPRPCNIASSFSQSNKHVPVDFITINTLTCIEGREKEMKENKVIHTCGRIKRIELQYKRTRHIRILCRQMRWQYNKINAIFI